MEARPLVCRIRVLGAGGGGQGAAPLLVAFPSVPTSSSLAGPRCLSLLAWVKGPSVCLAICLVSWRGLGAVSRGRRGQEKKKKNVCNGELELWRSSEKREALVETDAPLHVAECHGVAPETALLCLCLVPLKTVIRGLGGKLGQVSAGYWVTLREHHLWGHLS